VRPGCLPSGIAVGLTLTGPTQRETIERALEVGGFDAVQATWNLLEGGATSALAAARAAGVGMIIKEALANGRLTARGDVPLLARAAPSVGRYARCGRAGGRPGPALADVVLTGASTTEMLQSNLDARERPSRGCKPTARGVG
jgi:aryl-alcohol dehydrogenase-like predicted oxidoreductase